ncbi:hypothetical protein LCGC14_1334760 [marine sediment metagenome]|uniref:Uncharacterized protein n=1 Tax=marine sediment metagenome TaxID=412755 RepID=A0A0F9KG97_9ZZZZ
MEKLEGDRNKTNKIMSSAIDKTASVMDKLTRAFGLVATAVLDSQDTLSAADRDTMRRDWEREVYEQADEEDHKEATCEELRET